MSKKKNNRESQIQQACVHWFRMQHPDKVLFAVPNGGARDPITGAILKAEGVMPGVSDLILLYPSGGYHALCIEMKTDKGRQQPSQIEFQKAVERYKYKYVVCRNIDTFVEAIKMYMSESSE